MSVTGFQGPNCANKGEKNFFCFKFLVELDYDGKIMPKSENTDFSYTHSLRNSNYIMTS